MSPTPTPVEATTTADVKEPGDHPGRELFAGRATHPSPAARRGGRCVADPKEDAGCDEDHEGDPEEGFHASSLSPL